eukprot:GHRQ01010143.1.p1 GENE.GHRQ01010143.1~~GHRQ01010143.1.p1  ORF type:complete len:323 (-),score=16.48 GHRQ01010143.1:92-1060(-)
MQAISMLTKRGCKYNNSADMPSYRCGMTLWKTKQCQQRSNHPSKLAGLPMACGDKGKFDTDQLLYQQLHATSAVTTHIGRHMRSAAGWHCTLHTHGQVPSSVRHPIPRHHRTQVCTLGPQSGSTISCSQCCNPLTSVCAYAFWSLANLRMHASARHEQLQRATPACRVLCKPALRSTTPATVVNSAAAVAFILAQSLHRYCSSNPGDSSSSTFLLAAASSSTSCPQHRLQQCIFSWLARTSLSITSSTSRGNRQPHTWLAAYTNWLKRRCTCPERSGSNASKVRAAVCRNRHVRMYSSSERLQAAGSEQSRKSAAVVRSCTS